MMRTITTEWHDQIVEQLTQQISILTAELDSLRKDKQRLDWLERFFKEVGEPFIGYNDDPDVESDSGMMPVGFRIVFGESCRPEEIHVAGSLRTVIDDALLKGEEDV